MTPESKGATLEARRAAWRDFTTRLEAHIRKEYPELPEAVVMGYMAGSVILTCLRGKPRGADAENQPRFWS